MGTSLARDLRVPGARRLRAHRFLLLALVGLAATSSASEPRPPDEGVRWRREPASELPSALQAVAYDRPRSRLAVGDRRGLTLRDAAGQWRRWSTRAPVRDLAFDSGGTLWVATQRGLWRLAPEGRLADDSPAAGEAARDVRRIEVFEGGIAVACSAGVYWRQARSSWRELDGEVGLAGATALAAASSPEGPVLWVVSERGVFRAQLPSRESAAPAPRPEAVPLPSAGARLLDLAAPWGEAEVVLLAERQLFVRPEGKTRWLTQHSVWTPGARPRRLASGAGRLWVVTDRGVLESPALEGPWQRAGTPAGRASAFDLAPGGERVFAATESGLLVGERASPGLSLAPSPRADAEDCEPDVVAVHQAALAYLQLEPRRIAELGGGFRRRAFLPVISLRASRESDRSANRGADEKFVSGALRNLFDRERERSRQLDVGLTLTWDLREIFYHPEQVEVSEEARRLIQLRDDVLDEINQLYFERRRILGRLSGTLEGPRSAVELDLRARELAAGLDAWTGGWFGRRVAARCQPAAFRPVSPSER